MKWFIDQGHFIITRDGYIPAECSSATAFYFPIDSDFVKTIIEAGLANVSLGDFIREHIEKQCSKRLLQAQQDKAELYEKLALLEEQQGDATADP